jgi:hypothetical protein
MVPVGGRSIAQATLATVGLQGNLERAGASVGDTVVQRTIDGVRLARHGEGECR